MHIHPLRKQLVMFNQRPKHRQVNHIQILAEKHRMRIAHRHTRHRPFLPADPQGQIDRFFGIDGRRNFRRLQNGLAHIHADSADVVFLVQFQTHCQNTPSGFHTKHRRKRLLPGYRKFMVSGMRPVCFIKIFGQAADAVAAHLGLGAVGVEHPHFYIRRLRRANQNQTVRADPKMAIAHPHRQPAGVFNSLLEAIDINIIIAQPLHFNKFHNPFLRFRNRTV